MLSAVKHPRPHNRPRVSVVAGLNRDEQTSNCMRIPLQWDFSH